MVIIWDITGQQQKGGRSKAGSQSSLPLQEQPRHILYGHQDAVICLAVCTQLDLVVSAAADGNLLIHTLSSGRCDAVSALTPAQSDSVPLGHMLSQCLGGTLDCHDALLICHMRPKP